MKYFFQLLLIGLLTVFNSTPSSAQILRGAGIVYFDGDPNVTPDTTFASEVALNVRTQQLWLWNRNTEIWERENGFSKGIGGPSGDPLTGPKAYLDVNSGNWYRWNSTVWVLIEGAGGGGGEANTASSQGTGQAVFKQKAGVDLQFNSIGGSAKIKVGVAVGDSIPISIVPASIEKTDLNFVIASGSYFLDTLTQASAAFALGEPGYLSTGGVFTTIKNTSDLVSANWVVYKKPDASTLIITSGGLLPNSTGISNGFYWQNDTAINGYSTTVDTAVLAVFNITDSGFQAFPSVATVSNNGIDTSHSVNSISGIGTTATPLQLENDSASPGNNKKYGTSGVGVKGWFDDNGISDGNKGDITVSGAGTVFGIDAGVVGSTELASSGVGAGSYTSADITVDEDGRITAATNGTIQTPSFTTTNDTIRDVNDEFTFKDGVIEITSDPTLFQSAIINKYVGRERGFYLSGPGPQDARNMTFRSGDEDGSIKFMGTRAGSPNDYYRWMEGSRGLWSMGATHYYGVPGSQRATLMLGPNANSQGSGNNMLAIYDGALSTDLIWYTNTSGTSVNHTGTNNHFFKVQGNSVVDLFHVDTANDKVIINGEIEFNGGTGSVHRGAQTGGSTDVNGRMLIVHGAGFTPDWAMVHGGKEAQNYTFVVDPAFATFGATTFVVTVYDDAGAVVASSGTVIDVYYQVAIQN